MAHHPTKRFSLLPLLIAATLGLSPALWAAGDSATPIRIGVLSHRGDMATYQMWSGTADYLTDNLSGYDFSIIPLDFAEVEPAVASRAIDFVLVNPGIYVNLEVHHRVSRIATLNNLRSNQSYNLFGGVIFTLAYNDRINSLKDLRGKHFTAVDETSLGGYQMAWGEMQKIGIDPREDLAAVEFAGTHDQVVRAVLNFETDAGTVRTDILERMAEDGEIDLSQIRVINAKSDPEFPFVHSTDVFPEWPFSKLHHTPNELAQKVAVALLNMPKDHLAALSGMYAGWTIPLDYQPVHDLFRRLNLPPYDQKFTLVDVVRYYWHWLLLGVGALLFTTVMSTWVWRLNRQLERAKGGLERQHNLILDSVAEGIYGVDTRGNSTFVNKAMERMTGWTSGDLIGKNQHEYLHHTRADGSPHPASECPVYATFRDDSARYVEDDVFWRKDGSSFPVEYSSTPVHDDRGEVIGAVVVFRDTTERKQSEERIRKHRMELAHVSRLSTMGEMASNIAHELNQPLAAVTNYTRGCINMLRGGGDKNQIIEAMERVATQAERAGEIIRQLRQFIRKEPPERALIDINRSIHDIAVLINPDARREGVMMRLVLDHHEPKVWAHGIQIEQVIVNLARNAIDAMQENEDIDRRLVIKTESDGEMVTIKVTDNGPGIEPNYIPRLFDPFFTTKSDGMGLGLSISRSIVEAHGGNMSVESKAGEGTTFMFTLPIREIERD